MSSHPLLSQALKEAYASCTVTKEAVDTLEVRSSTGSPASLYLCKGFVSRAFQLENLTEVTFQPAPFEAEMPAQDSTGARGLTVSIENVDGAVIQWMQAAKRANAVIQLKYRTYLVSTTGAALPRTPQNARPIVLTVKSAVNTLKGVTFSATVADVVNRTFPNAFYSFSAYPGLRG